MSPPRAFAFALMVAAVVAFVAGILVYTAPSPSDLYFMPGPLGRVRRPAYPFPRVSADRSATQSSYRLAALETVSPEAKSTVPPASWSAPLPVNHRPGFLTRSIGLREGAEQAWGRRNGITESLSFSHHLLRIFPPPLYLNHPEFFPLVAGQRFRPPEDTYFWQPDLGSPGVARYAAQQAKAFFQRDPDAETFSLGVNDGLLFGESPETLALTQPRQWFRGRPDFSRLVFTFMNRVAADLGRGFPGKYLGCLAYYWCEDAPPFPVDSRVIPFLTADRSQSYDPAFLREEFELQARWARALRATGQPARQSSGPSPRLGLYDYLDGFGFLIPRVPIHAFAEHIKHAHAVGFTDYYGESSRNWGLDGPMPWVIAQLLRNPDQKVDALLDEYYRSYFQSAAEPMRRFFDRCEYQWMHQSGPSYWLKHYRNESQAVVFPSPVCAELRQMLNEAAARANNTRVRERVAFVANAFGVTERFVDMCEARVLVTSDLLRHQLQGQSGARELIDYLRKRAEFIRYSAQLAHDSPLAFNPIGYDDFLRDDPSFAATLALVLGPDQSGRAASRRDSALPGLGARDTQIAARLGSAVHDLRSRTADLNEIPFREAAEAAVADALNAARTLSIGRTHELFESGSFEGVLVRNALIAGLPYRLDLPAPWLSRVEPAEHHDSCLVPLAGASASRRNLSSRPRPASNPLRTSNLETASTPRALRISGAENTYFFQWAPAIPGRLYVASGLVRARVSPGDTVMLVIGWLNDQQQRIGEATSIRLPDGEWPDWVRLEQAARAPSGAAWVGVTIIVQHQSGSDFAEFTALSLGDAGK